MVEVINAKLEMGEYSPLKTGSETCSEIFLNQSFVRLFGTRDCDTQNLYRLNTHGVQSEDPDADLKRFAISKRQLRNHERRSGRTHETVMS